MRVTATPSRPTIVAVIVGVVLMAPGVSAAAPSISGADGDQWNTTPTYVVTPDADAFGVGWQASNGQASASWGDAPFTVALAEIAEGAHTLTVVQQRPGTRDNTTIRRFIVDRTAPGAVRLGGPATVTSDTAFGVSWNGQEAGARAVWSVRGDNGSRVPVVGPIAATAARADIPGLPTGSYTVQVVQTDVAGNAGPAAVLPVEVIAGAGAPAPLAPVALTPPTPAPAIPAAPAPPVVAPTRSVVVVKLPALRTSRLKPRRAAVVKSRRPLLRWARGPAGTTLYNVQIFRVGTPSANASVNGVPLRKVRSVFPKKTRLRTPALVRGACYVWRVWPYRGAIFTRSPLGVSHFCVAARAR